VCVLGDLSRPVDEIARTSRDSVRSAPASGAIAIIEIDAKSVRALSPWPWPRRYHETLVKRLHDAGAMMVAFDLDMPAQAKPVTDRTSTATPAQFEGGKLQPLQPDGDGQLRRYHYQTVTAGTLQPALAVRLARIRMPYGRDDFRIDGAVDPASIPRFSYSDILNGSVPPSQLKGRAFIVGVTATGLGDRYIMPGRGIQPGVVVQAMAAETLLQGTDFHDWGPWLALALVMLCMILWPRRQALVLGLIMAIDIVVLLPFLIESAGVATIDIGPAIIFVIAYGTLMAGHHLLTDLHNARQSDSLTGLQNERALIANCRRAPSLTIIIVQLQQFAEMSIVLNNDERRALTDRIVERLRLAFPETPIHAIAAGVLALPMRDARMADITDRIEGACSIFCAPIDLARRRLVVTPSFGLSRGAGEDAAQLIAQATIVARTAFEAGQRWAVQSDHLASTADRALILLADLDRALSKGDITVAYQPKWSFADTSITGAEALVRWRHPVLGEVSPEHFIQLLEDNRRIADLTLHVVDACLLHAAAWRAIRADFNVAVNISPVLLSDKKFVQALSDRIGAFDHGLLTLEITESVTISRAESSIATLRRLRALGARISIDDYGTGQSTLTYLKRFPADEIKIDRSFVTDMLASASDQILVRSTIALAHELNLTVVAEGVEDDACLARLNAYGCDAAQGWQIGKAMAPDDLTLWLGTQTRAPKCLAG
jgi:diguanylate cyclase